MIKEEKNRKSRFFIYILIIFLFEPNIFVKYNVFNVIFIAGAVISFGYILIKTVGELKSIPTYIIIFVIYRAMLIFTTVINNGDIAKVGYISIVVVALLMYAHYFHRKDMMCNFISVITTIFTIYLIINLYTYIIYPEGLYQGIKLYFLGMRTRFTEYAITLIILSVIDYWKNKNKLILLIRIIVSVLNITLPSVATGITGILITLVTYFVLYKGKLKIDCRLILVIGIVVNFLVFGVRIQNIFAGFIEGVLHKDLTLTGRTAIWDESYKYIFNKNIFIGNGYPIDGNFVFMESRGFRYMQSHNQILQLLYESGLIGTVLFYGVWLKILGGLNECKNRKYRNLILSITFSYSIMMISEIYAYFIPFYVIWILSYYANDISKVIGKKK